MNDEFTGGLPASVIGIGVDIVDTERFATVIARTPRVVTRLFTDAESLTSDGKSRSAVSLAARFAAKEAVGKALGIGMTRWHEVEVVRGRGAPTAILAGRCLRRAGDLGVVEVMLSLTHSRGMAAAVAILRGASPRQ